MHLRLSGRHTMSAKIPKLNEGDHIGAAKALELGFPQNFAARTAVLIKGMSWWLLSGSSGDGEITPDD